MTDLTRTQLIATLDDGWGTYVARYRALSPAQQQQWLASQGYARFGDLLAHVVAWWVDGQQVIAHVAADPAHPLRDYDVLNNELRLYDPALAKRPQLVTLAKLDLPDAQREAQAIARQAGNATLLLRRQASESAFRKLAPQYPLIHIASHGQFASEAPLKSALLLSPEGGSDGRLSVDKLYSLKLTNH